MALSFRQRILLVLIALGSVPTAAAVIGWALTVRTSNPSTATKSSIEQVAATGRTLLERLDTTRMSPGERQALAAHAERLNAALGRVERQEAYTRYYYAGLTVIILGLGAIVVYASARLGGHLSRQLSRPIDELVGWTGKIQRGEPLPETSARRGAPEFEVLRSALRETALSLRAARARDLEAERLRAFREMARRVAHEMKNPLTPIRLAVAQLERNPQQPQLEALEVIREESGRLEQLAREFTELGRLPEGPAAEIDLAELMRGLLHTSLPPGMSPRLEVHPETVKVWGHYDPLRRAFGNILQNAVEAMNRSGPLEVALIREADTVVTRVIDHGPGIALDLRERIFEPYFTGRAEGTGLGLTLVKQSVEADGGSIQVVDTPGGGATFEVRLPFTRVRAD